MINADNDNELEYASNFHWRASPDRTPTERGHSCCSICLCTWFHPQSSEKCVQQWPQPGMAYPIDKVGKCLWPHNRQGRQVPVAPQDHEMEGAKGSPSLTSCSVNSQEQTVRLSAANDYVCHPTLPQATLSTARSSQH